MLELRNLKLEGWFILLFWYDFYYFGTPWLDGVFHSPSPSFFILFLDIFQFQGVLSGTFLRSTRRVGMAVQAYYAMHRHLRILGTFLFFLFVLLSIGPEGTAAPSFTYAKEK